MAGLVMVIFVLLAAFVVVLTIAVDLVRDVKVLTAATQATATESVQISKDTRRLVDESKPCAPADPPTSPACERARRTESIITQAIDAILRALAGAIEAHDLNTHRQHEDLRQRVSAAPTTTTVPRTPITAPPPAAAPVPTSTTTTRPSVPLPSLVPTLPTTTTTTTVPPRIGPGRSDRAPASCPTLPNGRCHPGRG